jgi:FlaG/FlaF family flagellin (archaellin)
MYRQIFWQHLKDLATNEKGEGMVGWILATLLTVTIVMVLHGAIIEWLEPFWSSVQARIESIV